jgi:hypothetical protein
MGKIGKSDWWSLSPGPAFAAQGLEAILARLLAYGYRGPLDVEKRPAGPRSSTRTPFGPTTTSAGTTPRAEDRSENALLGNRSGPEPGTIRRSIARLRRVDRYQHGPGFQIFRLDRADDVDTVILLPVASARDHDALAAPST